jgi:hypothetical protein
VVVLVGVWSIHLFVWFVAVGVEVLFNLFLFRRKEETAGLFVSKNECRRCVDTGVEMLETFMLIPSFFFIVFFYESKDAGGVDASSLVFLIAIDGRRDPLFLLRVKGRWRHQRYCD